jgi:hypothetical protein
LPAILVGLLFFHAERAYSQAKPAADPLVQYPQTILYNGKILTMDKDDKSFTVAQAVAIRDKTIIRVGKDPDVLKLAGPATRKINLAGKVATPGLIETHKHMQDSAMRDFLPKDLYVPSVEWDSKAVGLKQLKEAVAKYKAGEPVYVRIDTRWTQALKDTTRWDLDTVSANNPVFLLKKGVEDNLVINTKALEMILARFPEGLTGLVKDAKGIYTGLIVEDSYADGIIEWTFLPRQKYFGGVLADPYAKQMVAQVSMGVTTVSTRIFSFELDGYLHLDRQGKMIHRLAYSDTNARDIPHPEDYFLKLTAPIGHGSEMIWMIGVLPGSLDGSLSIREGRHCTSIPQQRKTPWGPYGECKIKKPELFNHRDAIMAIGKLGLRITGMHSEGDAATSAFLDLAEQIEKERGRPLSELKWTMDHCGMVNPKDWPRIKKLGIMMSCYAGQEAGPRRFETAVMHGEKVAREWAIPTNKMLKAGLQVVNESMRTPGISMWADLTGAGPDSKDKVYAPEEKLDRETFLLLSTRWAARYVLKEKELGSIETGKWADIVVWDRDIMKVPAEQLKEMQPLLTMIGGKMVYAHKDFAKAQNIKADILGPDAGADDRRAREFERGWDVNRILRKTGGE